MSKITVHKVTLKTGKVVVLRDMKISDQKLAAQAAGANSVNETEMGLILQEEILKLLLVSIDEKSPTKLELEKLDELFTMSEYGQIIRVIKVLMGNEEMPKMEMIL